MTKKDYEIIARIFRVTIDVWIKAKQKWYERMKSEGVPENFSGVGGLFFKEKIDGINKILASIDVILKGFCFELKKDNPKFDEMKFRESCELPFEFKKIKNNNIYPITTLIEKGEKTEE